MKKILLLLLFVILLIYTAATKMNEHVTVPNNADGAASDKVIVSSKDGSSIDKPSKDASSKDDSSTDETFKEASKPAYSKDKPYIALVNRSNRLDKNFVPVHLVVPNVKFTTHAIAQVKKMDSEAALALESLFKAAKADNITLLAVSGYRDYEYQNTLYKTQVSSVGTIEADKYVAQPGASEHQTGLAMDVLSSEYGSLDEGFSNTRTYKWLEENSYKYGFIIRYPKGKESITGYSYEPWHVRYVGISAATEITQKHLTLEEYLGIFA